MTTIVTRAGKGSALTNNEVDANFTNLNTYKAEITASTGSVAITVGTTAQRDASPSAGYFRFNSTTGQFEGYNGTVWGAIGGGAGAVGGGSDKVFYENDQTITTSYTLTTNKHAMSTGPLTVNSGVTITIPSGARWVVL